MSASSHTASGTRQGFTLLEMAIVLIVIGLITGGIVAGKALIHTSEVNNLITQFTKYKEMTDTFRTKYNALPGDMADAFSYWSAVAGCTNADVNVDAVGCNGSGDNHWDGNETFLAWHHLYRAGLAEGVWACDTAANVATCGGTFPVPGQVGPELKLDRRPLSFYPIYADVPSGGTLNVFQLSGFDNINTYDGLPALIPTDAQRMDEKLDDGLPEAGMMQASTAQFDGDTENCVDNTPDPNTYDFTAQTQVVCRVLLVYE